MGKDREEKDGVASVVPIVFATDTAYLPLLSVAINSIRKNCTSRTYHIYILHLNVSQMDQQKIAELESDQISIYWKQLPQHLVATYKDSGHISKTMYLRFFCSSLLPNVDKLIYLDCDVVVNCDLKVLYDTDLTGYYIGAVKSAETKEMNLYIKKMGLDPDSYINSGVLLMNAKSMRDDCVEKKLCEDVSLAPKGTKLFDQDAINRVCKGRILFLDSTFNYQWSRDIHPDYEGKLVVDSIPDIIHYSSPIKPWHKPNHPLSQFFYLYAQDSPYKIEVSSQDKTGHSLKGRIHTFLYDIKTYGVLYAFKQLIHDFRKRCGKKWQ